MDALKKAATEGEKMLNKDDAKTGGQPAGGDKLDLSDGFQVSDAKAIAGGKSGVNLQDGIDAKDAKGIMDAFGNKSAAGGQAQPPPAK